MPTLHIDIKQGRIIGTRTSGMKAKPVTKLEKLRRIMTRNRNLDLKTKWKNLNSPIIWPKLKD